MSKENVNDKKKKSEKKPVRRMSQQEILEWNELYEYVKTNVLEYDKDQSLSRSQILRLRGLRTNKFYDSKKGKDSANYSYKTILNTFKYCIAEIRRGIRTNAFNDEMHKFNYILKIVEPKINTVYIKMKNVQQTEENKQYVDTSASYRKTRAKYQRKTVDTGDRFKDLW